MGDCCVTPLRLGITPMTVETLAPGVIVSLVFKKQGYHDATAKLTATLGINLGGLQTVLTGTAAAPTNGQLSSDSQAGFTQVTYRGTRFAIHTDDERDPTASRNHSLQALSLLNELVSAAKVSSDIPNTQEIQFVP